MISMLVVFGGGLTLISWSIRSVVDQVAICERAGALLDDIGRAGLDDTPNARPRDLVPAELAKAFPGSVPLQASVLTTTNAVRETIPEAAAWHRELARRGFVIGWVQPLSFRGLDLVVKMEEFGSHRQAVAFATWLALNVNCRYSNEVFTGTIPGSIGFQIRYRSGDIGEQLTFVRGASRYTVSVLRPDAPADHTLVDRLALEVARIDQG